MTAPTILRRQGRLLTETVRSRVAGALAEIQNRAHMSQQTLAERLGKSDRKSAADYLAGTTTMDLVAFLTAIEDPELGDEFGNDVLQLVGRRLTPITAHPVDHARLALDMSGAVTTLLQLLTDGVFDHCDRRRFAKLLRPLMPKLQAIIAADDEVDA